MVVFAITARDKAAWGGCGWSGPYDGDVTSTGPGDRSVVSVAVDDTPWCATGAELVADRLFALGASAVSELVDADGVGPRLVGDLPSSALGALTDSGLVFEVLEVDPTWNDGWRDHATVVTVGERLALRPEWVAGRGGGSDGGDADQDDAEVGTGQNDGAADGVSGGRVEIVLDAADAFGSGSHATTRLCLEAVERLGSEGSLLGARVLDVGSGTGVLGVAALLLADGASLVAVDVEPAAVAATVRTAELNGVSDRVVEVSDRPVADVVAAHGPFDLVLANLLVPIIEALGSDLAAAVAPGGHLVLSGLLSDPETGQVDRAVAALGHDVEVRHVLATDGWAAVVLHR